jgi:transcriptional regulator with XRE-family HTH domain
MLEDSAIAPAPAPAPTSPPATATERIGARVAALRRQRGLSLTELATRAGVGKATLSGVEAGTRNATLETLYAITGQLGVPLAAILADPAPPRTGVTEVHAAVHGAAVSARLLDVFDEASATFEYYRVVIRPGRRQLSPAHPPGTTEHLTVFSGHGIAGPPDAPIKLGPGTYAVWDASRPHVFEAEEELVAALLIRSPHPA